MSEASRQETFEFRAETRQLLDIVIHSLYSNKEIFLRELISNASDALDRHRHEVLVAGETVEEDALRIELAPSTEGDGRTLRVSDNGVGMSRDEVLENLGTIAKSGTRELAASIREAENAEAAAELIGQFGVGFYSAFMVADRVEVVTRRASDERATRWVSSGDGSYAVEDANRFHHGTDVVLHLKPVDEENGLPDFADAAVLERVVKRHSDFVHYSIVLQQPASGADGDGDASADGGERVLNSRRPLWTRPRAEVSDEELAELYRHVSHDWQEPLDSVWLSAEGRIEYKALLFVPSKAPYDLYYRDAAWGLRLYVRRVMIQERAEELLPPYLRFVRGVVESSDLPLNVSREMVQHDRHIAQMRRWLTKKILEHLKGLKDDRPEDYATFWRELGRVLKEGVATDHESRDRLVPLMLFPSTHDGEALVSFADYLERMPETQTEVYYLAGDSRAQVEGSPLLEAFRARGVEVLFLLDPVDEFLAEALPEVEGKPLRSIARGEVDLEGLGEAEGDEAKDAAAPDQEAWDSLMERLRSALDDHVKEVRLSRRLTSSPACLVAADGDMSPHLERLLRQSEGMDVPKQKRVLEINPDHALLTKLRARHEADAEDARVAEVAEVLYGQALLAEGAELPDPARFARQVAELVAETL
ncbi:MAG: molecular chaperone HtpG [Acidobacteriota bacterium]